MLTTFIATSEDCKKVAENGLKFFTTLKQKPGRETIIAAASNLKSSIGTLQEKLNVKLIL